MQPQDPYQPQPGPTPAPAPAPQPVVQPPTPAAPNITPEQFSVDYLNKIAGPASVKKMPPVKLFALIGSVVAVAIIAMVVLANLASPAGTSEQTYALQARIATLQTVTTEQGKHLAQNELSIINSTLGATLKSMAADLSAYEKAHNFASDGKAATSAKTTEKKYYDTLSKKLNDAYLTGTLDRTYVSELVYQLGILKSKMQRLKSSANSTSFNDFYTSNIASIDSATKQLSQFQSTK